MIIPSILVPDGILKINHAIGLPYLLDAPCSQTLHVIQVDLIHRRRDIRDHVLLHDQLEQQLADSSTQRPQLSVQHIRKDAWEIAGGVLRIQIAGIESDRLLDVLVFRGTVVFCIAGFYLAPRI